MVRPPATRAMDTLECLLADSSGPLSVVVPEDVVGHTALYQVHKWKQCPSWPAHSTTTSIEVKSKRARKSGVKHNAFLGARRPFGRLRGANPQILGGCRWTMCPRNLCLRHIARI